MAAGWMLAATCYMELRCFVLFCSPKLHLCEIQVRKVNPPPSWFSFKWSKLVLLVI